MEEPTESLVSDNVPAQTPILTESDYESHKIFAGGLSRETTTEGLKQYFERFGEVTDAEILPDRATGRSRGFGFVTFASKEAVKTVLSQTHRIDRAEVEVKLAVRKEKSKVLAPQYDQAKRIFVGGVSERITDSYFRDYFARYGPIMNYNYLVDKVTNKPRGYGFVVYQTLESAERAIGPHISLGRNCEAKRAMNKGTRKQDNAMPEFDYSAYYYAQANLLYSQYLSQMYNGENNYTENRPEDHRDRTRRSRERSPDARRPRRSEERRRRRSRSRSPRRSRSRSRRRYRR